MAHVAAASAPITLSAEGRNRPDVSVHGVLSCVDATRCSEGSSGASPTLLRSSPPSVSRCVQSMSGRVIKRRTIAQTSEQQIDWLRSTRQSLVLPCFAIIGAGKFLALSAQRSAAFHTRTVLFFVPVQGAGTV